MPANKKTTREDIINAAFEVLRENGFSAVNARNVAKKLGCSTQPIYFSFQNMNELKSELTKCAIKEHRIRVMDSIRKNNGSHSRYSDFGIGFIRFAEQEKQLFRWLYLEDGQADKRRQYDIFLPEIIHTICEEYGYQEDTAVKLHQDMIFYSYGLAVLTNTGNIKLSDTELINALRREFLALTSIYGDPPKQPPLMHSANVSD